VSSDQRGRAVGGLARSDPSATALAELTLAEIVARVAAVDPTPGAGPSLAWTCALAAALEEMVSGISLGQQPANGEAITQRRARAATLRETALGLADADAYRTVLAVRRGRTEAGHAGRLRDALHSAADPLVLIVEVAGEVTRLAADATGQVRGGARGADGRCAWGGGGSGGRASD
jgi:formiminotetrahydrofolate cyclodeaminase